MPSSEEEQRRALVKEALKIVRGKRTHEEMIKKASVVQRVWDNYVHSANPPQNPMHRINMLKALGCETGTENELLEIAAAQSAEFKSRATAAGCLNEDGKGTMPKDAGKFDPTSLGRAQKALDRTWIAKRYNRTETGIE